MRQQASLARTATRYTLPPLIHIVPTTPPEVNGLTDYCRQLWRYWPEPEPKWAIASPNVVHGAEEAWPGVSFHPFERNASSLGAALEESGEKTAVLHYVGYGYDARGVPAWLPKGLEKWKSDGGKLVTMFHEIYASGPPWKSEFWLRPKMVRIAQQIVDLSDRWITSCPDWFDRLTDEFRADSKRGCLIPISSAIDPIDRAPVDPWPLANGKQISVAIFGFPRTRSLSLSAHRRLLSILADKGRIHRVMLIGREPDPVTGSEVDRVLTEIGLIGRKETLFNATSDAISKKLSECAIGLSYYPYGILSKSSAFAAYAVHGLTTVIPKSAKTGPGPFLENDEFRPEVCWEALQKPPKSCDTSVYLPDKVAAKFAAEVAKACASS